MRSKAFLKNSASTALLQITTMIVGFIVPRIMISNYGSEINGLIASVTQLINYFNLLEAGLAGAAIFSLYKPLADKNTAEISRIVVSAKKYYNKMGTVFLLLIIITSIIFPSFLETDLLSKKEISLLIFVIGLSGVFNFYTMSKYRVLLTADQKVYVLSFATMVYVVLNVLIISIFAYFKVNVILLKSFSLLAILSRSIILYSYLKKNYKYINYNSKTEEKKLNKRWDVLYLEILGTIQRGAPIFIATIFTSLKMVSIYSIYNLVTMGVNNILSIFISGLNSSFGDVIAKKEEKTLRKAYSEFEVLYYILLSWVYICTFILITPFINYYTRDIRDISYSYPLIGFLITLNGFLYNLKTPQGMLIVSAGMYRETRKQTTIQAIIGLVGSIVLVQIYRIEGILIAFCLSNLYRVIDLSIFVPKNILKIKPQLTIIRILRTFLLICGMFFFVCKFNIIIESISDFLVIGITMSMSSLIFIIFVNLIFEYDIMCDLFIRIKRILKRG